ncbi:MAG: SET domain-containing protein-lysine N-methyltransferase, partial [Parachlamydiaceae bacterium]|nr:SET domain-containing protein-lysine N-methyltransferase [Parachlamydiaceae bacterium]
SIMALLKGTDKLQKLSEKLFQQYFKVAYLPHLAFFDYEEFKRVLANCPWVLAKSFLGEENREQAKEFSSQLKSGHCANISIRWIDEQLEYGVFAETDMAAGTYIGEFTGAVRHLSRKHPTHNIYCFHYPTRFWSWNYYVIDALRMGNQMRFINHSDRPNLQPLCLCERRLLHIVFIAKVAIKAGEQLTYDYGQDFWKTREKIDI